MRLARTADEPDVVDFVFPALVVLVPVPVPESPPVVPEPEEVPPVTDVAAPGRLTVAWLARDWKAERVLFDVALSRRQ
jgi:hypothetical protein